MEMALKSLITTFGAVFRAPALEGPQLANALLPSEGRHSDPLDLDQPRETNIVKLTSP
jgi:hypothetical protein